MPNYIVNLPVQVEADDPTAAVEEFMQTVLRYGLRPWSYQVVGENGTVVADGDGAIIEDIEQTAEATYNEGVADESAEADEPAAEPE